MNHHELKDEPLSVLNVEEDIFSVANETENIRRDKDLLKALEKSHHSSSVALFGVSFVIVMSFFLMIFGSLIILDQFPETSWIMQSVLALF